MPQTEGFITRIEFEDYRGFQRYAIQDLRRVNLLVGRNNSGKTTVLEAVLLLVTGGDPSVLERTAWQRGELTAVPEDSEYRRQPYAEVSHVFWGHRIHPGVSFALRTDSRWGNLEVRILDTSALEEQPSLFSKELSPIEDVVQYFALRMENGKGSTTTVPITDRGFIPQDRHRRPSRPLQDPTTSVQFITPDSLMPGSMGQMWDQVIVEGRESEVIRALQILEPKLTSVFFLSSDRSYALRRGGVLLGFSDEKQRVPLGSFGEGMRRFLALSLSLIRSAGGILLVDEIDTGLHWSIMKDMWRLVVAAAEQSNVQVFATTHSFDCLKGLAELCEEDPKLADAVSLQKIDPDLDEAVSLVAGQVKTAIDQNIEVR